MWREIIFLLFRLLNWTFSELFFEEKHQSTMEDEANFTIDPTCLGEPPYAIDVINSKWDTFYFIYLCFCQINW